MKSCSLRVAENFCSVLCPRNLLKGSLGREQNKRVKEGKKIKYLTMRRQKLKSFSHFKLIAVQTEIILHACVMGKPGKEEASFFWQLSQVSRERKDNKRKDS